ncbi:MAG: uracil-DNA glycosylase [Nitrospirota bacterium]
MMDDLAAVRDDVIRCVRCPRLRRYCEQVARTKRRAYCEQTYWGKPVPGFGDPNARLLIVGLAPAAHGGNRTGRIFTGDRSGDFLFAALHRAGFANQPTSIHRDDGLRLIGAYVAAVVRCAPPDNRPTPREIENCRDYLMRELRLLTRLEAVLALGRIAFDGYLQAELQMGRLTDRRGLHFGHGATHPLGLGLPTLFAAYHPSQQNTQTGRLTAAMFDDVLMKIKRTAVERPRSTR